MTDHIKTIREALLIGANHRWGDGDYTAFFEKALAALEGLGEGRKERESCLTIITESELYKGN